MFNISPNITKDMDNQPLKYRKDFKPCKINITTYETNEESTSELGICIVFGLFRGMVDGMDGGIICVSTCKYDSKSESKGSHISISIDSWEYTGNESSI